ncbi:efflux RND transporter permease subunit [bacterium]|nr:efflux RND transporter permease subunit [bacterium]
MNHARINHGNPDGDDKSKATFDDSTHWVTAAIRNRRLLVMMIAVLVVAGLASWSVIPRMEDPVLNQRAAIITTRYPVADAEQVETLVTDRIEQMVLEVEEIKELKSQSRSGASLITIELRDDVYDTAPVWSRIRGKVEDSIALLPPEASRPEFDQLEVRAFAWIGALVWESDSPPNYAILGRFAEDLEDRLRGVSGTDDVEQFGKPDEEIVVEIDPSQLANMGLSASDVASSILSDDARNAAGFLRSGDEALAVELSNQLKTIESIRQLPVKSNGDGGFVVISDFARVDRTIADPPDQLGRIDGRPAMLVGVMVRTGSRIDLWRKKLGLAVEEFETTLPPAIGLTKVLDQNEYVAGRLSELISNLAIGSLAVMVVVWLLMGWRNALLVSTALPLVTMAVLTTMRFQGVPIHQMSLAGLIIALGLLIDNAIVIVDSVSSQLRNGKSQLEAVGATGRILFIPLLASTLTTAFAFAPICLMEGPAGEFVGSMASNVICAVISSLFISLLVIAPLTAILGNGESGDRESDDGQRRRRWWGRLPRACQQGLRPGWTKPVFERVLRCAIQLPWATVACFAVLAGGGFYALSQLPDQFFPPADRDQFHIELEMPQNASFAELQTLTDRISQRLATEPRVQQTTWLLGRSAPTFYYNIITRRANARDYAHAIIQLDSADGARNVIRDLQTRLQREFPEARLLARQLEQGPPFAAPIEVKFYGADLDVLRQLGDTTRLILSELPHVVHTRLELNAVTPTVEVDVSTQDARLAGMRPGDIASQLSAQLEGATGGFVLQETEQLPVRVRVAGNRRSSIEDLNSIDLVASRLDGSAQRVPLSAVASLRLKPRTGMVARENSVRVQEVQAYLTAGVLPSEVLTQLEQRLQETVKNLPPGYRMAYGGEASKRDDAVGGLMANVGILVMAMITTLVLSIGSFRGSLIIGAVALMAIGFGGMSLFVFGYPFGFMAIVGVMGLIGIAINDSIVVLTALRENKDAAVGDIDAIIGVTLHETRHVLATTFTTIAGFMPLILSGGGFWPPMAIAIAGGVVGCTLSALLFVPVTFGWLMRQRRTLETRENVLANR